MKLPHSCKRDDWKEVPLAQFDPNFVGKKIVLVGYSVRALNYVAKYAGFQTLSIDCFADMDLRRLSDEFIHVNLDEHRDNEGKLKHPAASYLTKTIEQHSKNISAYDYLLLGSSFENSLPWWETASKVPNYCGTSPKTIGNVRNPEEFFRFLSENSFHFPLSLKFVEAGESLKSILYEYREPIQEKVDIIKGTIRDLFNNVADKLKFPLVLKSANSGGGLGIKLIKNEEELEEKYNELKQLRDPPYVLQEYIEGTPMSCSVIGNSKNGKIHTISQQIIGEHRFGCKGEFTYCGNVMNQKISDPNHPDNTSLMPKLTEITQKITEFAQLRGSFGIDFVKKKNEIYVIEVNPRFQGTIDLVLTSTGENIINHHINSITKGILPPVVCFPDEKTYMKVIYYSPIDFHIMVDLQGLEFVDVPLIGSYLPEGVPICSNIISGESYDGALSKALDDRDLMIRVLGLKSRIPDTNPIKIR